MGRKVFFDDDQQTPDTMNMTFDYGGKAMMFEMRIWNPYGMEGQENGVAIYGTEGAVHIGRWGSGKEHRYGWKVYDRTHKLVSEELENEDPFWHQRNFIDCVRTRQKPNADIGIGHTSSLHCHLANIVARTGRNLKFDAKTETIAGDEDAAKLLRRDYREHWAVPKGV